jgi:hypothetical protein
MVRDVLGFPRTAATAGDITVAESAKYYRVVYPLYSSLVFDQVNRITLTLDWTFACNAEASPPNIYSLQNQILVSSKHHSARAAVIAKSGAAKGFEVPATGTWYQYCNTAYLSLTFMPPALVVQKSATTLIVMDIPRRMKILGSKKQISLPDILNFTAGEGTPLPGRITVTLSVGMASGNESSACSQLQSTPRHKGGPACPSAP